MNQLEYVPGIGGQSVQLDGPTSFVGIAENLRSREWEYDLGYRDLVSATRPAREVDVTFDADYTTADTLRRVADADVTARTPGTFIAQNEWKQRGYILASDVNDIHYGRLSTELKIALLDGAWWRLVDKNFMPEDTTPTYRSATGKSVTTDGAANVPLHALTVDGESVQDGTPTPEAPVPIYVVDGKNLLASPTNYAYVHKGITYSFQADGSAIANGTASANSWLLSPELMTTGGYNVVLPPGTYTASGVPGSRTYVCSIVGDTRTTISQVNTNITTFTLTETTRVGATSFWTSGTALTDGYVYTMVEEGSTATPYVPYGSIGLKVGNSITPIDLQGNVLASLPNGTKDVLTVDSAGHCVLTKNVGKTTVDGSVTFGTSFIDSSSMGGNCTRITMYASNFPSIKSEELSATNSYMSIAVAGSTGATATPYPGVYSRTSTSNVYLTLPATLTSATDATEWLTANNFDFLYPLEASTTIDLGYIDMPLVSDGSVVSVSAAVTPTITAEWQTSPDLYLDYPHNYPHDYKKTSSTESITPSVLTPSDVRLVIYGPAVNPYVIVGGNRYQVNVTVPSGGYLIVDGRKKTIMLTLADGTVQNVFSSGVRGSGAGGGSYIFERIPAGTSEVTYDGSFGFDLGWYEEEGEPPWSLS